MLSTFGFLRPGRGTTGRIIDAEDGGMRDDFFRVLK